MATNVQERQATKAVLPPGPARLPYIGNLLSLRLDTLGYLQRLQRAYGNMATIYFGKNPAVLLFRPEYIRYVLVEHPRDFSNRGVLRNDNDDGFASEGLLTIDGEKHRQQRRAVQPAFHKKQVEATDLMFDLNRLSSRITYTFSSFNTFSTFSASATCICGANCEEKM